MILFMALVGAIIKVHYKCGLSGTLGFIVVYCQCHGGCKAGTGMEFVMWLAWSRLTWSRLI